MMPTKLWMLILTIGMTVAAASYAKANDYSLGHPNIAASLWDQPSQGLAVALVLSQRNGDKSQNGYLEVYIHNMSDRPFGFNPNHGICGVRIFYVNNAKKIPLRDHHDDDDSDANDAHLAPGFIKPSETLRIRIDLTPDEMTLIKANPVICSIPVYSGSFRVESGTIETTPKMLSVGQ